MNSRNFAIGNSRTKAKLKREKLKRDKEIKSFEAKLK